MANGTATLKEAMKLFGPEYVSGQKKGILASVGQSAVSSGLSGTTRPGAVSAGMLANLEQERRLKLAGLTSNLAQMQSTEQMEAGRLGLSKAALALEKATAESQRRLTEQAMGLKEAEARQPGGALSSLPTAPQGYQWGGGGVGARYAKPRLTSVFSPARTSFQRF